MFRRVCVFVRFVVCGLAQNAKGGKRGVEMAGGFSEYWFRQRKF